jgi:hypothetical protein
MTRTGNRLTRRRGVIPMAGDYGMERVIAIVDLRQADIADLISRPFTQFQVEYAGVSNAALVDPGRVVIIDEVDKLVEHHDLYAHVLDSHVDISVLCVAVGPGSDNLSIDKVRRPGQLAPPKAATLWIGDIEGVGWRMDSSQADVVHSTSFLTGRSSGVVPDTFLGAIGLRPVFDRVLGALDRMPGAVASPGIRAVRCDVDSAALAQAKRRAASHLAGMRSATQTVLEPISLSAVLGPGELEARSDVLTNDGQLDLLYKKCLTTATGADRAVRRFAGPSGLFGADSSKPRSALRALGAAIKEYADTIERLLDRPGVNTGLDVISRDELSGIGISVERMPDLDLTATAEAVNEWTVASLDKRGSLPAIAAKLRGAADALVPQGTGSYLAKLTKIRQGSVPDRLAAIPGPATESVPPWLALVTFVVGLLAGAWPTPVALCGALAVLGITGVALWITAIAKSVAGRAGGRRSWILLAVQGIAGLVGAAVGVAISKAIALPGPSGPAGIATGVGLVLVLLVGLALLSWSALARRWTQDLNVPGWQRSARALRELIIEVTAQEFLLGERRRAAADLVRAMANAADEMTTYLRGFATASAGPVGEAVDGQGAIDRQDVIGDLVLADVSDAAAVTFGKLSNDLRFGLSASAAASSALAELESRMDAYLAHLESTGLSEAPTFTRETQQGLRRRLAGTLLERTANFIELLETGMQDVRISQLCTPPQLSLVEPEPTRAEMIKFAPRPVQELLAARRGQFSPPADQIGRVEWTRLSKVAGTLRLVPVRVDAVDVVWPTADDRHAKFDSATGPATQTQTDTEAERQTTADELSKVGYWPNPPPDDLES